VLFRRRRNEAQPVVLPSLDRLSGLIERVVELVDAVGDPTPVPAPEPVAEPPREAQAVEQPAAAGLVSDRGWVAFVASPHGYRLVEGHGGVPELSDVVELEGGAFRVVKVGPSPLPGDRRRCAYVNGEEPPREDRTSDA
jgi:hypothetical protein